MLHKSGVLSHPPPLGVTSASIMDSTAAVVGDFNYLDDDELDDDADDFYGSFVDDVAPKEVDATGGAEPHEVGDTDELARIH